MELSGEEHEETLRAANNYAVSLITLQHFKEARALLRKTVPVARRVFGESNEMMLRIKWTYAMTLYRDTGASLDDLREAVTTLEEHERTARRVYGGEHPLVVQLKSSLQDARAVLRARETPSRSK